MEGFGNRCLGCRIKSLAASVLSFEELNLLCTGCHAIILRRGEFLFREGDQAGHVAYIREGFIKLYRNHSGRKEQILDIVKKGRYIGLNHLIPDFENIHLSAKAIRKTTVCLIEKECFVNLLKSNGEFATRVIIALCQDGIFFVNRLLKNQQQQLYGRLAEALLYFSRVVYDKNPFTPDMTRAEMASFTGASRESLTRALKDFQDSGFIEIRNKKIFICNEKMLSDLIEKG